MKKFLFMIIALFVLAAPPAFAQNGDVIGSVYSTDILAYVNGLPINSYNIGGRTAVVIEDLNDIESNQFNYGFKWSYDDAARTLTADSDGNSGFCNYEVSRGTVGGITGSVYETDIKVIFNGQEVQGFNIGGRTAVCIEDLGTVDDTSPNADWGYSKYLCNFMWNDADREVSLNTYKRTGLCSGTSYPIRKLTFKLTDNIFSVKFDQEGLYFSNTEAEFSDSFKTDTYKIKDIYAVNDDGSRICVGNMYMAPDGRDITRFDEYAVYELAKDKPVILTYEEALEYIHNNYDEILDTYSDDGGDVFIARRGDMRYLLYALKRGGLVVEGQYDDSYTTLELSERDGTAYIRVAPFGGPHGATTMSSKIDTWFYNFYDKYSFCLIGLMDAGAVKASKFGTAVLTVDGKEYSADVFLDYEADMTPLVDVDRMSEILGIDYENIAGNFVFNADCAHSISFNVDAIDEAPQYAVNHMQIGEVKLNGDLTKFTYMTGDGEKKEISPLLYDGRAFVPFGFFEEICNKEM